MSQKALFISYDGMTDPLGRSQVIPYLAGLSDAGIHITLMSFEKADRYAKNESTVRKLTTDKKIDWVPLSYTKSPPVLSTLWDVWRMYREASKIYEKEKFEVVHCRSYLSALCGLYLKKKYNTRMIFDMRGFWADERLDGNIWRLDNPFYKVIYGFFKRKEKEFLEHADHTITLTHVAKREIHSWKNISNNPVPITVIPCCADMNTFSLNNVDHTLAAQIKKDIGLADSDYVFLYLGSLGTWYMLDEMLDFFKVLAIKKPNARFLFVTNDDKANIFTTAEAKGIDKKNVLIVNAPFDKVPTYISLANSSIFFIKPAYSKKGSSPIKQGELMSMGVPVVCNADVGDTEYIVKDFSSGVVVGGFDTSHYEKAVYELLNTNFEKDAIIHGAKEYFSADDGIEKYLQVYQSVLNM